MKPALPALISVALLAGACGSKHASPPCTTMGGVRGADGGGRNDEDAGTPGHPPPGAGDAGGEALHVTGSVMPCPGITLTIVAPIRAFVGDEVEIAGSASNENGETLTLSWSASDGSIADRAAAKTTFTCAHAGQQVLTLTALSSQACTGAVVHVISCVTP